MQEHFSPPVIQKYLIHNYIRTGSYAGADFNLMSSTCLQNITVWVVIFTVILEVHTYAHPF